MFGSSLNKGMIAANQISSSEKSEENKDESEDRHEGRPTPAQAGIKAVMNQDGVGEPGDKGPNDFGIPLPRAFPGLVRPKRSSCDANSQQKEANTKRFVAQFITDFQRGKTVVKRLRPLAFQLVFLDQIHDAGSKSDP